MKRIVPLQLLAAFALLPLIFTACQNDITGGDGVSDPNLILPEAPKPTVIAGNGRLILKWNTVSGAAGYQVRYGTTNTVQDFTNDQYNDTTTETSYAISGLDTGTTYFVWVRSIKYDSQGYSLYGPFSKTASGTPIPVNSVPSKVTGLKATATHTSIKLSWNEVPEAASYRIQCHVGNSDYTDIETTQRSSPYTVTTDPSSGEDLSPSTTYKFRVLPENDLGTGIEALITARTLDPWPLRQNKWSSHTFATYNDLHIYTFTVPAGKTYCVQANQAQYGDQTKTAIIYAEVEWADDASYVFDSRGGSMWGNSNCSAYNDTGMDRTVMMYVKADSSGTYAIRYYDVDEPPTDIPPSYFDIDLNNMGKVQLYLYANGNIYRSTSRNGVYTKINSTSVSRYTYFVDETAKNGSTYFYKVTSTENGAESARSNPSSIAVPAIIPINVNIEYPGNREASCLYSFTAQQGRTYVFNIYASWYLSNADKIVLSWDDGSYEYTAAKNEKLYLYVGPSSGETISVYDKAFSLPLGMPTITVEGANVKGALSAVLNRDYAGLMQGEIVEL